MKWFQRKSRRQAARNEADTKANAPEHHSARVTPAFGDLFLLLLKSSVSEIFEDPPDDSLMDAIAIMTSFGVHRIQGINEHQIDRLPVLLVTDTGKTGYTFPMRLDLQILLHQLATRANPPIDFPLGLFTNCDAIMVCDDFYPVRLFQSEAEIASSILDSETMLFKAPRVGYMGTTTDEATLTGLTRLEAKAKEYLGPEVPSPSPSLTLSLRQLPTDTYDFLQPIFKRAGESIRKA